VNDELNREARRLGREAAVFAGIFALAAVFAALIWQASVDLPRWQRSGSGVTMGPIDATKTIGIDAVYLFVSAPIGFLLGAGLTYWRRRTPIAAVVLIAIMSLVAAALMERFGLWLGPGDPVVALQHAAGGASAPVRLQIQATGVLMAWPATAVLGSLLVLLCTPSERFGDADKTASDRLAELTSH
jgi:hypothetical protein